MHPLRVRTEKEIARQVMARAIERGELVRPAQCSACRKPCTPHGHHPDYALPLRVVWLCAGCHAGRHALDRIGKPRTKWWRYRAASERPRPGMAWPV